MPLLRSKPLTFNAHKVRYEDIHLPAPDVPDWLQEMMYTGRAEPSPGQDCMLVDGQCAKPGMWILLSPEESLRVVTEATVAAEFELVG